jgi:hypothetical protein
VELPRTWRLEDGKPTHSTPHLNSTASLLRFSARRAWNEWYTGKRPPAEDAFFGETYEERSQPVSGFPTRNPQRIQLEEIGWGDDPYPGVCYAILHMPNRWTLTREEVSLAVFKRPINELFNMENPWLGWLVKKT